MKTLFGLGNPGPEYELTRHNVGFLFLDYILSENESTLLESTLHYKIYKFSFNKNEYQAVYPLKYMNLSGQIVSYLVSEMKIEQNDFIVIYDDFHLPMGKIRFRPSGSHAGHNGIKNIINLLDTNVFNRLRIGIDEPNTNIIDYVLGDFEDSDLEKLPKIFETCSNAIDNWSQSTFKSTMEKFNGLSIF